MCDGVPNSNSLIPQKRPVRNQKHPYTLLPFKNEDNNVNHIYSSCDSFYSLNTR